MIYLDNNATTIMPPPVIKAMVQWINQGNPSADYASARRCRELLAKFRQYIADKCGFDLVECGVDEPCPKLSSSDYRIVITSCASESNNTIMRSAVESYRFNIGEVPHLVISAVEHKSALECARELAKYELAEVTTVRPNDLGFVLPEDVDAAIRPNTCLVCVMHANNETGAINNIKKIGEVAHRHNVPFYTDAVQTFGKFLLNPIQNNVDAFCASFHKFHGPPGIGLLVIKEQFLRGYKLSPIVCGAQNGGFRGGTENISLVAAAFEALKYTLNKRREKNTQMFENKKFIIHEIAKYVPTKTYREYLEDKTRTGGKPNSLEVVFISTGERTYLPSTLLLSVVKRYKPKICNGKIKRALEDRGIIVSVGSACNTDSNKASHVLTAMDADELIRAGTIRVSLGDNTTREECKQFVNELLRIVKSNI